jgi:hypothetical protein
VAPRWWVSGSRRFQGPYRFHFQGLKVHEGGTFLRNVENNLPNDAALYLRRPQSSKLIPVKFFEIDHDSQLQNPYVIIHGHLSASTFAAEASLNALRNNEPCGNLV